MLNPIKILVLTTLLEVDDALQRQKELGAAGKHRVCAHTVGRTRLDPVHPHELLERRSLGRDRLAEAEVGAVVWADWWGFKLEAFDTVPANAALLDAAGVKVALHSDSPRDVQFLNREAAKAMERSIESAWTTGAMASKK